jgi:hypothetical protein
VQDSPGIVGQHLEPGEFLAIRQRRRVDDRGRIQAQIEDRNVLVFREHEVAAVGVGSSEIPAGDQRGGRYGISVLEVEHAHPVGGTEEQEAVV